MTPKYVHNWLTCGSRRIVLLAPEGAPMSNGVGSPEYAPALYDRPRADVQRLRGATYLEDGAVSAAELTADGRQVSSADTRSWHVLSVDAGGTVRGCARYLPHGNRVSFSDLMLRKAALAPHPVWGGKLRQAVEADVALARRRRGEYVEGGGLALHEIAPRPPEALRTALATYALSRSPAGRIPLTTATVRHCSAAILQKHGRPSPEFSN